MAKEDSSIPLTEPTRDLTLTLDPISGELSFFYAFIDGVKIIQADGTKKRTWSGKIAEAQVRIKIRVIGIGNATFKLSIHLPGTCVDKTLELQGGYYETEIIV